MRTSHLLLPAVAFLLNSVAFAAEGLEAGFRDPPQQAKPDDALPRVAETFEMEGHKAYLYAALKPAAGRPWVWYAPTLKGLSLVQRKAYFESFLRAGVSVAGFDLGEVRGSPASTAKFTQFYNEMVKRGWSSRPILLGQSRGGLMMLAWAMRHPDKTRAFVGIYPVCNLETWPMKNKAITLADYGLTEAQFRAKLTELNPLDNLRGLQTHKVPMFVVHGDSDAAVPYDENTRILKERYETGGGPITVKLIAGEGHQVSPAFFECRELIEFVLKQAVESNLEAGFRDPPQQAKPLVWWDWINGSVTREGIKADLEDMKRAGIGGVQLFDLELYMPKGPVRYGTDKWHEHVQYAIQTADRLGLEFHIMNCPGWSASGGPWITPEKSMKKLIWTEENVTGSKNFVKKLNKPKIEHRGGRNIEHNFYRDIAIFAVPADRGKPYRLPDADKKIGFSPPTFERPVHSLENPDKRAIAHFGKSALCRIAVGHPVEVLLGICQAVEANVGLGSNPPAKFNELIGSERVGLDHAPTRIAIRFAVLANSFLPVIGVNETPAGPADHRHLQFLERLDDIKTKSLLVGQRRTGLENATVNLVVKMLEESAEEHWAVGLGRRIRIDRDHGLGFRRRSFSRRQGHVVVPRLSGRCSPAAEEAVDFELGYSGLEDRGNPRPVTRA